jgi:hypothetical protein
MTNCPSFAVPKNALSLSRRTSALYNSDRPLLVMNRNQRRIPSRRPNPLRDLVAEKLAEKQRSMELARTHQQAEKLAEELPGIVSERVGEHIQKLETKLLKDFQAMGQRAIEESTSVLTEQFSERLETLEHISALQSKTIENLRDSSKIADDKVSTVVNSLESTLSGAVPGFRLEPSAFAAPLIAASTELTRVEPQELDEVKGKFGYCPKCTSTRIRRASRSGVFEQLLRFFFVAPFRCRACRHKFYRF